MNKSWLVAIFSAIMFFLGFIAFRWSGGPPLEFSAQEEGSRIYHQGETAAVIVRAINRSDSSFHVDGVSTSCGCTKPFFGDTPLVAGSQLPGKSTTPIRVTITTDRDAGEVEHSICITGHFLNSPRVYNAETKLKVMVAAAARVVPSELLIADAESGKPVVCDIFVLEGGMGDMEEVKVAALSNPASMHGEFFQATRDLDEKVKAKGYRPARRYSITLTPSARDQEDREFVDFILPGGDGKNKFRVNILCRKKPAGLVFSPPLLALAKSNVSEDVTREILCLASIPEEGNIVVLGKPPDVEAVVKNLQNGKYSVSLRIPAARIAAGTGFEMLVGSESGLPRALPYQVLITEPGK